MRSLTIAPSLALLFLVSAPLAPDQAAAQTTHPPPLGRTRRRRSRRGHAASRSETDSFRCISTRITERSISRFRATPCVRSTSCHRRQASAQIQSALAGAPMCKRRLRALTGAAITCCLFWRTGTIGALLRLKIRTTHARLRRHQRDGLSVEGLDGRRVDDIRQPRRARVRRCWRNSRGYEARSQEPRHED